MTAKEFLEKRSYREYPQITKFPYKRHCLFEHRVTKLESEAVCESNHKLCIHVEEYVLEDHVSNGQKSYEVKIVAERKKVWWELNDYSLSESELFERLEEIENTLIKLFNAI